MHGDCFLTREEVCAATTLSRATIWRAQRRGEFPKYEHLSAGRVGLRRSVLDRWIAGDRDWRSIDKAA